MRCVLQACGSICSSGSYESRSRKAGGPASARELAEPLSPLSPAAPPKAAAVEQKPEWQLVPGTPAEDEHFICMGSKAPLCPPPKPKQNSGPITLDVLQGSWMNSSGAQISVLGTCVYMNGLPMKGHNVELRDDGTVISIGRLWQLDKWAESGGIEFRASSTREGMESARLETWSRRNVGAGDPWQEKMRLLGYAGTAADPLGRGVEGCMPGTMGIEPPATSSQKDRDDVALLQALIVQWREPTLSKVLSCKVVPDCTNRAQTGLGVELVHYVATSMSEKGFKKRRGKDGHDIPVVVREPPSSETHGEALANWRAITSEEEGFPPMRMGENEEIFTSLGNGHFFQALNLFACRCQAINDAGRRYTIGEDVLLSEAISEGVPSIVLRHETPRAVRAKIAELLNSKRDFVWTLGDDGQVDMSKSASENAGYCSQFEWLSKGMDAYQVNCLVRSHLGIRDSKRIVG